jgi:hypothetical protein
MFLFLFLPLGLSNRPNPPPQRKSSLPKHSDVKKMFFNMCHSTFSDDVLNALRLPTFDSYQFEDHEILKLMETMFVELNFIEKFRISEIRLREWLYEVYKHYNDVPFHNFRHCFCVTQMVSILHMMKFALLRKIFCFHIFGRIFPFRFFLLKGNFHQFIILSFFFLKKIL